MAETPTEPWRLPRTVAPRLYRLCLQPDLATATFSGTAVVELTVLTETTSVVANAADLRIVNATIEEADGRVQGATVHLDEAREQVTFELADPLPRGPATLRCMYDGTLNDALRGFYRSRFTNAKGEEETLATTQMESTDARRAFPCWDEPDRKAAFEITLVVPEELEAFSNGPVAEIKPGPPGSNLKEVTFAPTMVMSSYLVAMIVGRLEATAPRNVPRRDGSGSVPVRIVHVPGKESLTDFALDVAEHSLGFFTEYFGIEYPAEKLDLVAIPDFAFGAMENLGCVTFRETALLVDPAQAARTDLERVADVVAHEIAHMWFGDLVTMKWWEGIWLNEAFATFMEVLCVDAFRPEWQRWVSFGLEREAALAVDGLHATRPIEYHVGSPEEADGMFDVLTYQKGGSVLRMLEQYLGPDVFRAGVSEYLKTHSYANTVTTDLWDALERASGEPVRSIMDTWILQGGHPFVSFDGATLTQAPFAYSEIRGDSAIGSNWQIPVLTRKLLHGSVPEKQLLAGDALVTGDVDVVNAGGWGVFRTGYSSAALKALTGRLGELSALERCNLFADTWALVLADRASLSDFFTLATSLGDASDAEPSTWAVITGALGLCDRVIADGDRGVLEAVTRRLLGPVAGRLGWEARSGEDERVPSLRALLLGTLGTVGKDPSVFSEAAKRLHSNSVDPNLESAVLGIIGTGGNTGDYAMFLERYRNPATPQEELRYLTALAGFADVDLSLDTFEMARAEVRTQNAPYLLITLLANRIAGADVWRRMTENWDELLSKFPENSHSRMLDGIRALCGDPHLADGVETFLLAHPLKTGRRSVEQSIERLNVNVAFGERIRPELAAALATVSP